MPPNRAACFIILLNLVLFAHACQAQTVWQALRQSFKLGEQSRQTAVKQQIRWLVKNPRYLQRFASQSRPYLYYVLETIKQQHMPGELALLPMIESTYNPFAYSHVGAAGLWQLMPGTGSGLGVKQNWWFDGRRSIIPSTEAALTYLTYLGRFFDNNWIHAIAAYDSGEGTVQRAIRKNKRHHLPTDFWSLKLPRETKAYLPRLLAMASIISYPRYYGVTLPDEPYAPYFEAVATGGQIDLDTAARLAGIPAAELLKINPGHNRWTTAPKGDSSLLIPINSVARFKAALATLPMTQRLSWQRHRVAPGESLSVIAKKNRSSVKLIQTINNLHSLVIKVGQLLLIPNSVHLSNQTLTQLEKRHAVNRSKKIGPIKKMHLVTANDSYASLEKTYHIKKAAIQFWNQLSFRTKLKPGQRLLLWLRQPIPLTKRYQVKSGDTLSQIAHAHHVPLQVLRKLNPKIKHDVIKPKQMLRLKA